MGPGPGTPADQYVFYLVNKPNRLVLLFASGTPGALDCPDPDLRYSTLSMLLINLRCNEQRNTCNVSQSPIALIFHQLF